MTAKRIQVRATNGMTVEFKGQDLTGYFTAMSSTMDQGIILKDKYRIPIDKNEIEITDETIQLITLKNDKDE